MANEYDQKDVAGWAKRNAGAAGQGGGDGGGGQGAAGGDGGGQGGGEGSSEEEGEHISKGKPSDVLRKVKKEIDDATAGMEAVTLKDDVGKDFEGKWDDFKERLAALSEEMEEAAEDYDDEHEDDEEEEEGEGGDEEDDDEDEGKDED